MSDIPVSAIREILELRARLQSLEQELETLRDIAKAAEDMNSCILAMQFAHGNNQMAESILQRHAAAIEKAARIALGFPAIDSARRTSGDERG